ncbi:MAG: Holliday junction branch migration protein RuvA [Polyangiales bacterium]
MIGRLHGVVVSESSDGTAVIDVHGVGYEVSVPLGTFGRAPRDASGAVTLLVVTNVREDAITLFGFANEGERSTFRALTAVAGIGPRIAIAVLGSLLPHELASAIARNDVKRLQAVPGVGKRLAERLALELKDKITPGLVAGLAPPTQGFATTASAPVAPAAPVGPMATLVATLQNLGFKPIEAERVAAEFADRAGEPLDALVRDALKRLVK